MALTCHLDVPPNVMPFTKPKEKKALPPGLKPRFVPFGSGKSISMIKTFYSFGDKNVLKPRNLIEVLTIV